MSVEACAALVRRADPDRAAAAELAPVAAQKVLWPIYALNVEVSRAPWVTQEPMIAEMRLQWWRDALEEIAEGRPVRAHEVTTALADAIGPNEARRLDGLVEARRWDIYKDPFEEEFDLLTYLDKTSGWLIGAAATAMGTPDKLLPHIVIFGRAVGLSRFLQAIPELEARGRVPLLDGRPEAIAELCASVLKSMPSPRRFDPAARHAMREGWQARALLKQAIANPTRVAEGSLALSPFGKSWRLLLS